MNFNIMKDMIFWSSSSSVADPLQGWLSRKVKSVRQLLMQLCTTRTSRVKISKYFDTFEKQTSNL